MVVMTIQEVYDIFEAHYVLNMTRDLMGDKFREVRQGGVGVQAYTRCLIELSLFYPEDVATNDLRVG